MSGRLGRNLTILIGQTTMDSRLRDITAVPPRAHTVNDLLTMYVGTASQHALRMTFVHESKGKNICYSLTFRFYLRVLGMGVKRTRRHAAAFLVNLVVHSRVH